MSNIQVMEEIVAKTRNVEMFVDLGKNVSEMMKMRIIVNRKDAIQKTSVSHILENQRIVSNTI